MKAKRKTTDSTSNEKLLIGEYLRLEREKKGISLEYISAQTKINYNVLKNLESDNFKNLPNIAYVKGFVQHYTKIINGDLQKSLEVLDYSYNIESEPKSNLNNVKELVIKPTTPRAVGNANEEKLADKVVASYDKVMSHKKTIVIWSAVGLVCFSIYGAFKYINDNIENSKKIRAAQKEVIPSPTEEIAPTVNLDNNSTTLAGVTENLSTPVTTPVETNLMSVSKVEEIKKEEVKVVEVKKEEPKKIEVKKEEPKKVEAKKDVTKNNKVKPNEKFPYVKFKKYNKTKIFEVLTSAPENNDEKVLPSDIKNKLNPNMQNIYITSVKDKTWISYTIDKGTVETKILKPGQDLFVQGNEVAIFLGNVNATKVFYNNSLIDPLSKNGVKSLIFPEDKSNEYFLPLFKTNSDGVLYKSDEYMSQMMPEVKETTTN